jgi:hypothetical protein
MDRATEAPKGRRELEVLVAVGLGLCFCGVGILFFHLVTMVDNILDLGGDDVVSDLTVSTVMSVVGVILIAVGLLAGRRSANVR